MKSVERISIDGLLKPQLRAFNSPLPVQIRSVGSCADEHEAQLLGRDARLPRFDRGICDWRNLNRAYARWTLHCGRGRPTG